MKKIVLLLINIVFYTVHAQQINGVFTDFARNDIWGNTVINTAVHQTTDHITLGGYYEGSQVNKKIPLVLQITPSGVIRSDFGSSGAFLMSSVNSNGSSQADRIYVANTSTTANSNQLIVAGQYDGGDGFIVKTWPTGTRPTAFNNGNITRLYGGGATDRGYIEDWRTGSYIYSIRMNGATFGNASILLSMFSRETGAPYISFGDSGTTKINTPENYYIDQSRPVRMTFLSSANSRIYVAFPIIGNFTLGTGIAVCCVNAGTGKIDSTYGTNGYLTFATTSRYYITSAILNNSESITIGGYNDDGPLTVPSFYTLNSDGTSSFTFYSTISGQSLPATGSKNVGATSAVIGSENRIVFAYSHAINSNGQSKIAIASHNPLNPTSADPLPYTPWLGSGYVSAEPTSIIPLLNNAGFIVTGKATRADGTFAGVVLKYTMAGLLDASFANQGVLIINGRSGGSAWADVTQMPNGKYMVCGTASFVPTALEQQGLLLQRFNSDGSIDSSFGTHGTRYAFQSDYARTARQIVPLPDGKFLIGGTYTNYTNEPGIGTGTDGPKATIYKLNADGTPDFDFGPFDNGRYHFPGYIGMSSGDIQLVGDDIYFGGNSSVTNGNGGRSMVLKLTPGGINNSTYTLNLRTMIEYRIDTSNFDLYASGRASAASTTSRYICRANQSTGSPDLTYGTNGFAAMPVINSDEQTNVREMKLVENGRLLAMADWSSATSGTNITYGIFFSLFNNSGAVENWFGIDGVKFLQIPGATSYSRRQHKWVANGTRLLIFGESNAARPDRYFVCQVNLNGDLDTSFGTGGIIWTNSDFLGARAFDNDGNLLAFKSEGFFYGGALQKMQIPADVYNRIKPGSWTGTIDNDWFKPGNWAEGVIPDAYTEVVINNGSVLIGAGQNAFAYNVRVLGGANLSIGQNANLNITKNNP
ncbi:MAG TPA: hypothetical protein PLY34_14435 [Ferruginibacter sp.]|nr:hypothetical protein [Ferruginibacter sp.]